MYRYTSYLYYYNQISLDSIGQPRQGLSNSVFYDYGQEAAAVLAGLSQLAYETEKELRPQELLVASFYGLAARLMALTESLGLTGKLWQQFVTLYLVLAENTFSLACEHELQGLLDNKLAAQDFEGLYKLFHYDFSPIEGQLGSPCFSSLQLAGASRARLDSQDHYDQLAAGGRKIGRLAQKLAAASGASEFFKLMVSFYQEEGCGLAALTQAFSLETNSEASAGMGLVPLPALSRVRLDHLVGYQSQKERLVANTEAFLAGGRANNLLLHGDSGTGKSTCVRALLNHYADQGLKIIEVYKHQFQELQQLIMQLAKRKHYYILYLDDLSFEDFETDFKYLKAVIEGGLADQPPNLLIYATSNRRHLIRETWADRSDRGRSDSDDIHHSDTAEEKISLVNRFGLTIYFPRPGQEEYLEIVKGIIAQEPQINLPEDLILGEAKKWGISFSNISGRRARQFVNYLLAKYSYKETI